MRGSGSFRRTARRLLLPNDLAQKAEEFGARRDWDLQSRPRFLGRFAGTGEGLGLPFSGSHDASILPTMTHPLDDARLKLRRAQKHLKAVRRRILTRNKRQGQRPPYDIEIEIHDTYLVARIIKAKKVPREWSLIAGDALVNFRAALDYTALQMVKVGSKPRNEEGVYFPIQISKQKFPGHAASQLPGVRPDHLAVVERHQPYHWGTRTARHPFALLAHFTRIDKHRRIAVVLAKQKAYRGRVRCIGWHQTRITVPRPGILFEIKRGAELFRIWGYPLIGQEPKVIVDLEGAVDIAFENGVPLMEALGEIDRAVSMILTELTPLF